MINPDRPNFGFLAFALILTAIGLVVIVLGG